MKYSISIKKLSDPSITRSRGKKAADKLVDYIKQGNIDIDLNTTDVVSLSFLDELICHFNDEVNRGKIVFITDDNFTRDKLSLISGTRNLAIHYRSKRETDAHLVPISESINLLSKSTFATSKTNP